MRRYSGRDRDWRSTAIESRALNGGERKIRTAGAPDLSLTEDGGEDRRVTDSHAALRVTGQVVLIGCHDERVVARLTAITAPGRAAS